MKTGSCPGRIAFAAAIALLLTGCLFKTSTVPVRYFMLAPVATNEPPVTAIKPLSVGIGFVKMPTYLLRDSLVVRTGANEIEYVQDALWGERLDQSFQRTIAANLSRLLPSDNIYSTDWARGQVMLRVFISVQQFDVDNDGRGTLIARWRIAPADSDASLKSDIVHLERTGAPARNNPEAIAATLSDLTAEFSRGLAQSIREVAGENPRTEIGTRH
jgi:uncharacterized lipoprotein YmbA